jgi:hypothetical protein
MVDEKQKDEETPQPLPKALAAVIGKIDLFSSNTPAADDVQEKARQKKTAIALNAELKKAICKMQDEQLSLFDIAPWANHMRAIPNDYARSALFTVRNKRIPRAALESHEIFHANQDSKITYTGIELRAEDDELVWQQVMEYVKRITIGQHIEFTFYQLCEDLGWPRNGRYYDKAQASLSRLHASSIQFSSSRVGTLDAFSLISKFKIIDKGGIKQRCRVQIDPEMIMLFAGDHYSKFHWERYRKLSPTARRMFDYFSTHREPFPLKLDTFRRICGSDSIRDNKWREQVKNAALELEESGLINHIWVENTLIHCKR